PNAHARAARHGTGPGDRGNDSDARIKSGGASAGECATGLCADEFGLRRAGAFPALRTAVHGGVHVAPWEAENQSGERPNARASGVVKNRPKAQVLRREKHPQPGSYCNFQKSRVQTTSGRIEPTVSGPFLSACEISGLKPLKATSMRHQSHLGANAEGRMQNEECRLKPGTCQVLAMELPSYDQSDGFSFLAGGTSA